MKNFVTLTMLKRYGLAMLCLAVIGVLLVVVEKISDIYTAPSESLRVYQLPESSGIETLSPKQEAIDPKVLAEHLKKVERLQVVEAELMKTQPTRNHEQMLAHLELEEEMLTLHQEFGTLVVEKGDPFLSVKIGKLMLTNLTDDQQLPVSVGMELVDLLVESGKIDDAAIVYMATQRATDRGDTFFQAAHWQAPQHGSEDVAVTSDLCCPDETQAEHQTSASATTTPSLVTTHSMEAQLQAPLSLERFNRARELIDEYGTNKGLERLRSIDPEAVGRLESVPGPGRERRGAPPREAPSSDGYSGTTPPDDSR